ncbi:MAG: LacI family DNA-binding transcriptional regulator [Christensenellales bacterium]
MHKRDVSIKKISELTGYSIATVSRVINNKGRYSKETEQIINETIKRVNYVPNMIAKGLRTRQANTIGILVPGITNEFYSSITLAVQNALFDHSFSTFICNTYEKKASEDKHLMMMKSQSIGGLIFVCSDSGVGDLHAGTPRVYVDRMPLDIADTGELYLIASDNYSGGRMATAELIDTGCRRILMLFEKREFWPRLERSRGVLDEIAARGEGRCSLISEYINGINFENAAAAVNRLLDDGVEFDGIFCYTDIIAAAVIGVLHRRGIRVPEDVKIVGFNDLTVSRCAYPTITTVRQDTESLGRIAAGLIINIINKEDIGEKRQVLPVELIRRESTRL